MPIPDASVTLRRTIAAPPARVYRAWTDPNELMKWFGPRTHGLVSSEVDLRVGGRYRFGIQKPPDGQINYVTGEYRELAPNARLVFTWTWEHMADVRDTLVTVDLREAPKGTELRLTHELLPNQEAMDSHTTGWTGTLDRLAEMFNA